MTAVRDQKPAEKGDRHRLLDGLRLLDQCERIENHSTPDHTCDSRLKNSRWNEMQHVAAISDADGMSGIVAALITRHAVEAFRKNIDDLTFSFVAPLNAYDCGILFH